MRIGDVSTKLGMPASTIRYYEKAELIAKQRRVSGRRVFDCTALQSLEFIKLAQSAGFSIAETKALLDAYAENNTRPVQWLEVAQLQQKKVRDQILKLEKMEQVVGQMIVCPCKSLPECLQVSKKIENKI